MIHFRSIDRYLAHLEQGLLIASILTMVLLSVAQILLRNLFGTSLFWIDPLIRLLVLWLAVLGTLVASRSGEHLAIDAVKHYLSDGKALIVTTLTRMFAAFICGLMSWHSLRFVIDEWRYETPAFAELPLWPFALILPIGFALMTLRFSHQALKPGEVKATYE